MAYNNYRDYRRGNDYRDRYRNSAYPPYRDERDPPCEKEYRPNQQYVVPFRESYSDNRNEYHGGRRARHHHGHHGHHHGHHDTSHHDNRHSHKENRHGKAQGAILGLGIAELVHNHREKKGENVSHGVGHVARTVCAGVLGAVALHEISEYRHTQSPS